MTSITRNKEEEEITAEIKGWPFQASKLFYRWTLILFLTLIFIRSVSDNTKKIIDKFKCISFAGK